ncbi:glycine cleavage system aminomethyltransferase GcvT, partial [Rhodovulum sulfidophilum]|nr:glycine cleavage system aminomethyltransferase GcvT [Rhodovulum sulfidophilum]
ILGELDTGAARQRVGLRPEGRAPMREGTALYAAETGGEPVGTVTSGGFGPSVGVPVSMGYVPVDLALEGAKLWGEVRGKRLPAEIVRLPFRPSTYKR